MTLDNIKVYLDEIKGEDRQILDFLFDNHFIELEEVEGWADFYYIFHINDIYRNIFFRRSTGSYDYVTEFDEWLKYRIFMTLLAVAHKYQHELGSLAIKNERVMKWLEENSQK